MYRPALPIDSTAAPRTGTSCGVMLLPALGGSGAAEARAAAGGAAGSGTMASSAPTTATRPRDSKDDLDDRMDVSSPAASRQRGPARARDRDRHWRASS